MTSPYFRPLVILPVVVTEPGAYRTRSGETVSVLTVSTRHRHEFGCRGRYGNGVGEAWHKSGRLYTGVESANDIVARL